MDYTGQYWDEIQQAASQYNIDPSILLNLIAHESAFNPNAMSPAGAQGIAQFMPGTAADLGIDPMNPQEAIPGAAQYLRKNLDQFGGNYSHALAGFNAGPGNVSKYGGIPPFPETQAYVNEITNDVFPEGINFVGPWKDKIRQNNAVQANPLASRGLSVNPPMKMVDNPPIPYQNTTQFQAMDAAQMGQSMMSSPPLEAIPGQTNPDLNPFVHPEVVGASAAQTPGIMAQAGQNLTSPMGAIGALGTLAMTDWENPESVGSSVGGIAGGALGGPAAASLAAGASGAAGGAAAGAAAGSVVPVVGTIVGGVAGGLLGGEVGKLFGGDDEEEKAKKEQKYAFIGDWAARMGKQTEQYGQDRRKAVDRITDYMNQSNQRKPYEWVL